VKFTGEGGVIAVALSADGSAYELRIADSGIGIEPAFLPHVFDRFRQADGTTTRQHAGLGLGLAIVKELTELHGGAVRAASPGAGRGATFTVRLPKLPGLHAPEPAGEPARPRGVALAGIEVLAVDDNPDALEVVAASLSSNGASVRVADSGEHAIAEWDRAPAQVLICDLAMPGLDGFAVLRAIRQRTAAAVPVPAIALTAYASTEFHARTRDAGFEAHLAKPFDEDELVRTILAVLGRT
jgi:CheY-like chemotaxis protein